MASFERQKKRRKGVQIFTTVIGNAYIPGFLQGAIYQGSLKRLCLPGLNCYSCPGAIGACPIGTLQNSVADPFQKISLFVLGFLILLGGLLGRLVCGWLCPFGLFQEALYRLPGKKWQPERKIGLHRGMLWGKYAMLAGLVFLWPLYGQLIYGYGDPTFCKYICPSGTLMAGWPLLAVNEGLRQLAGWLFGWKSLLLILTIALSVRIMRPFCRYVCPLGAIYGLFNRISLYRVRVDWERCTRCGACTRQCPMAVPVPDDGNGPECIRCGECEAVCPYDAIHCGFNKPILSKEDEFA